MVYLDAAGLEQLWNKIKLNFVRYSSTVFTNFKKGDLLYIAANGTLQSEDFKVTNLHVETDNPANYVLGIGSGVPVWKTISSGLAFSTNTSSALKLRVTVLGTQSAELTMQEADASHLGVVNTGPQIFAGAKTFNSTVILGKAPTSPSADDVVSGVIKMWAKNGAEAPGGQTETREAKNVMRFSETRPESGWTKLFLIGEGAASLGHRTDIFGNGIRLYYSSSGIGLTITDTGNVGIGTGTASPASKLHVVGNIQAQNGGVSANGLADLSVSGSGGGSGTVKSMLVGSTTFSNVSVDGVLQVGASDMRNAIGLGSAAVENVGSVTVSDNGLVRGSAVYSYVNSMLSSTLKFRGITTSNISDDSTTNPVTIDGQSYTAVTGDVVIKSGMEYLWASSKWNKLGDDSSYALKTVKIIGGTESGTGYGISVSSTGTLEADRTVSLTSATLTALGNIIPKTIGTAKGDLITFSAANTPARLGIGTSGQYLKVVSGAPAWATFASPSVVWTDGTSSGPSITVTTDGGSASAAIPTATSNRAGVVTTESQTFSGAKTFKASVSITTDGTWDSAAQSGNGQPVYLKTWTRKFKWRTKGDTEAVRQQDLYIGEYIASNNPLFTETVNDVTYSLPAFHIYAYQGTAETPQGTGGYMPLVFGSTEGSNKALVYSGNLSDYSRGRVTGWGIGIAKPNETLDINGTLGVSGVSILTGGVGIGTFTRVTGSVEAPDAMLHVKGSAHITSTVTLDSTLSVASATTLSSSVTIGGNVMLANDTSIGWNKASSGSLGNMLSVNQSNQFIIGYANRTNEKTVIYGKTIELYANNTKVFDLASTGVSVTGTLGVSGAATLSSTLSVVGTTTFGNDIYLADAKTTYWKVGDSNYSVLCNDSNNNRLHIGYGISGTGGVTSETRIYGTSVKLYYGRTVGTTLDSNGVLTNVNSIQSTGGGVAAMGIADLALSGGGGGSGTVKTITVNSNSNKIEADTDGNTDLYVALSGNTNNAIQLTLGGVTSSSTRSTVSLSAANLRTYLNIDEKTAYVTNIGTSGNTLTWSKGGVAQTAITVPYATKASQDASGNVITTTYATKAQLNDYVPMAGTPELTSAGRIDANAFSVKKGNSISTFEDVTVDGQTVRNTYRLIRMALGSAQSPNYGVIINENNGAWGVSAHTNAFRIYGTGTYASEASTAVTASIIAGGGTNTDGTSAAYDTLYPLTLTLGNSAQKSATGNLSHYGVIRMYGQGDGTRKYADIIPPALSSNTTLTLPSATGTLALTSDISTALAGYLPLTGGTVQTTGTTHMVFKVASGRSLDIELNDLDSFNINKKTDQCAFVKFYGKTTIDGVATPDVLFGAFGFYDRNDPRIYLRNAADTGYDYYAIWNGRNAYLSLYRTAGDVTSFKLTMGTETVDNVTQPKEIFVGAIPSSTIEALS